MPYDTLFAVLAIELNVLRRLTMQVKEDCKIFRVVAEEYGSSLEFAAAGDRRTPIRVVGDRFVRRDVACEKRCRWLGLTNVKVVAELDRGTAGFAIAEPGQRRVLTSRRARSV